jgi:5,10-methylenetetrahydromethanopterin reductase
MNSEKTRIGYNPSSLFGSLDVIKFARSADHFVKADSIWMPESWGREAFVMLGAISQVTSRIKLGTSIISIFARSPATTSMAASTLDTISSNRVIIGIGASTPVLAQNWHGIEFREPLKRMQEFAECFTRIVSGDQVNYDGKFFRINNFRIMNASTRKRIPIFFGAVNSGMINLATKIADGVILYLHPLHRLTNTVQSINSNIEKHKKPFEICSVFITAISEQYPEIARRRAAKTLAFYTAVGKYYSKFLAENGFQSEVSAITEEYKKNGIDQASNCVSEKMLRSLAIYGDKEDCVRSLRQFMATGITLPILQVNPVGNPEDSINESLLLSNIV